MADVVTVDTLPEPLRRQVLDALLQGQSLRSVAKLAGCSHLAIKDYRKRVVFPAIRKARQLPSFYPPPALPDPPTKDIETKDIRTSPFRQRLDALWERTNKALDATAPGTEDFRLHSAILSQAHKNLELFGRVTGDLADKTPSVAIQIVIPQPDHPGAPSDTAAETIDIALPVRR